VAFFLVFTLPKRVSSGWEAKPGGSVQEQSSAPSENKPAAH